MNKTTMERYSRSQTSQED